MLSHASPDSHPVPLAVVGAGPHALTLVLRLLCAEPAHTDAADEGDSARAAYWRQRFPGRTEVNATGLGGIKVFDPSGRWMAKWTGMFSALEIPHLRSPAFLNPDPSDPTGALFRRAAECGLDETDHFVPPDAIFDKKVTATLRKAAGKSAKSLALNEATREGFALPSSALFEGLCAGLAAGKGLDKAVVPAAITRVVPVLGCDGKTMFFDLHADDGSIHRAERVVIATGPQGRPRIPSWVHEASAFLPSPPAVDAALLSAFGPHLLHTCQLGDLGAPEDRGTARRAAHGPLRALLRDKKVLIIGGGLTSGHLLVLAAEAGCEVTLLSRRQLAKRQFDLDAAWMTRARTALLNGYYSMPPPERAAFVARCRGGGTITPEVWVKLWEAVEMSCGKANVIQGDEVERAEFVEGNGWNLHLARSARVLDADIVVLATGCAADVASDPLFADLLAAFPIPMHNGLPELDHDLRWAPGVHVHVMGSKAALQLGPDALNLAGAMGGARRLWPVLRPVLEGIDGPEERKTMAGGKTKSGKSESMTRLMGGDGNLFAALCDESASEEEED